MRGLIANILKNCEGTWKEAAVAYFSVMSWHVLKGGEATKDIFSVSGLQGEILKQRRSECEVNILKI
jgi:hypothetical protein